MTAPEPTAFPGRGRAHRDKADARPRRAHDPGRSPGKPRPPSRPDPKGELLSVICSIDHVPVDEATLVHVEQFAEFLTLAERVGPLRAYTTVYGCWIEQEDTPE